MDTYLAVASKRDWRRYADRPLPEPEIERILDAGRLAGSARNRQPWRLLVTTDAATRQRIAETVYAPSNVRTAPLVVAIVTPEGKYPLDVGRAMQNMFLVAWNDGVVSCPNGMPDPELTARALGLESGERPVIVLTFGYPPRPPRPEGRSAEEWSAEAKRRPLGEVVQRL